MGQLIGGGSQQYRGGPCCPSDHCWFGGIEALWWEPAFPAFQYAYSTTPNPRRVFAVYPNYDGGVRLFLGYKPACSCVFADVGFTYYRTTNYDSVIRPDDALTIPMGGTNYLEAYAKLRTTYLRLDAGCGFFVMDCCRTHVGVHGGLRYLQIRVKRNIYAAGAVSTAVGWSNIFERSQWRALGVELSLFGTYDVMCDLGLEAKLGVFAGVGEQQHDLYNEVSEAAFQSVGINHNAPGHMKVAPGANAKLGITYAATCCDQTLYLSLGYEFDYYFEIMPLWATHIVQTASTASPCSSIGFMGPYFSVMGKF